MDKDTFVYNYSAKENAEVQAIRKKYLPREESKLEELKRLDYMVQSSGMVESLSAGIGGALFFGLGMCLAMQVIGEGLILILIPLCSWFLSYDTHFRNKFHVNLNSLAGILHLFIRFRNILWIWQLCRQLVPFAKKTI